MKLATLGKPESAVLDMFTRIVREGENLPVPAAGARPLAARVRTGTTELNLSDGRALVVDGAQVDMPAGTGRRVTGNGIKAAAGVYRGRVLFKQLGTEWQRIGDNAEVELAGDEEFKTEPKPQFRSLPRFDVD